MMPSTPAVSVLMGVYNAPSHYLDEAIQSILSQSFADFEFIIVDDGSGLLTSKQLQAWAERDARVRIHRLERNVGLTRALNEGLTLVRSAYVARQDADDISDAHRLSQSLHFLQQNPGVDAVGTHAILMDAHGLRSKMIAIDSELQVLKRRNTLVHGSMMFRRRVFELLGGYNQEMRLSQDYELYLRMVRLNGMHIGVLSQPLYFLRQHRGSLSSKETMRQFYFSVLAKKLTLPTSMPSWRKELCLYFLVAYDLIITNRMFIGVFLPRLLGTVRNATKTIV